MSYIPIKTGRVANATIEMGAVLPIGATIYDVDAKKTYKLIADNTATDTVTILLAANKLIELGGDTGTGLEKVGGTVYPIHAGGMAAKNLFTVTTPPLSPELVVGAEVLLSGGTDTPEKAIILSVLTSVDTIVFESSALHNTHTIMQRVAMSSSWKLIDNPTTVTKDSNVNLMPTGDPTQESVVEVEGIKYKSYTTVEIAALPDYTLGTFLFDSTLNSLVQCTDATAGANVWKAIGGSSSTAVTSFNTRTGAVVPASGDYDIAKIIGLQPALDAKAPIAAPTFTGVARAETAGAGTNTTQIATTAFVKRDFVDIGGDTMTGNLLINTSGGNNFSLTSPVGKSIAMGISGSPPEFTIVGSSIASYKMTSYDNAGTIQSALTFKADGNLSLIGDSDADVTPADDKDLATKKYVDDNTGGITEQPAIPDLPTLTSTPTDAEFDDIINKINTTLATLRTAGIIAT